MKTLLLLLLPALVTATYIPAVKFIDDNDTAYGVTQINGKVRTSSKPYTYDIAEGHLDGHEVVFVYGYNGSVGTTQEAVIPTSTTQNYMAAAAKIAVTCDSTRDSTGNAGARTVVVTGLDSLYAVQAETLTLDGVTGPKSTKYWLRPLLVRVLTAGTAGSNLGNVYVKDSTSTTTYLQASAGRGQSHHAIWTVPDGYQLHVVGLFGSDASSKGARISLYYRPYGGAWTNPAGTAIFDAFATLPLACPFTIPAKADIQFRTTAVLAGAIVTAGLEGWYDTHE